MDRTVVFIHGAWVTPGCWDDFATRFEGAGYLTVAPSWPHDDQPVEELRADPAPELAGVGVGEIVDHYAAIIEGLDRPPVLVGHSFGGLFVQVLLDRGLGSAGIAIDSAPPKGVLPGFSAIRASFPVIRAWRGWRRVLTIDPEHFAWGFTHNLSAEEQREVYERRVIPTPGRPFFQAATGSGTKLDYRNGNRAPLLLIAGDADRTVPASMNRSNFRKYRSSEAVTEFRAFPGRSHWIIAEPGWEEVADVCLDWLEARLGDSRPDP